MFGAERGGRGEVDGDVKSRDVVKVRGTSSVLRVLEFDASRMK